MLVIQWIILGVAIYIIIGLILAKESMSWIEKAVEKQYMLEEDFKNDVEYTYARMNAKEDGKLFIIVMYLIFSISWLPMYIIDWIEDYKNKLQ